MRKLVVLALTLLLTSPSGAEVWVVPYRCDETTPLPAIDPNYPAVYQDIMVGTRLALIVRSDTDVPWRGWLRLSWDDAPYATLSGRGYASTNPVGGAFYPHYQDSCLASAGGKAHVTDVNSAVGIGFELTTMGPGGSTDTPPTVVGDWFVIDYRAEQVGPCNVGLYDALVSYSVPIQTFSFMHVPSRDFNGDATVDFQDFALLASHRKSVNTPDPNGLAAGFDLNGDAKVDLADLALFGEYWLERTDCTRPDDDPNAPLPNPSSL